MNTFDVMCPKRGVKKALIWEDGGGAVWLTYNDPRYLKQRYAAQGCDQVIAKMTRALANYAKMATMP